MWPLGPFQSDVSGETMNPLFLSQALTLTEALFLSPRASSFRSWFQDCVLGADADLAATNSPRPLGDLHFLMLRGTTPARTSALL